MRKWQFRLIFFGGLLVFLLGVGALLVFPGRIPVDNLFELIDDFSGGMNSLIAPHKLTKNFSPRMYNAVVDEVPGSLVKPGGFSMAGSTGALSKVNFMFTLNYEDGSREYLVSDSSVVVATTDFMTFRLVMAGLTSSAKLNGVQVRNKVWMTNGVDAVFTYDGSTVVVLNGLTYGSLQTPNVPRGKYIEYGQGRVFVYSSTSSKSGLYFSELGSTDSIPIAIAPDDYRAWPGTNLLKIDEGDGSVGTGLWWFKGQLQLGKERSIHTLFGTGVLNFYAKKTESRVGPVSDDGVVVLDNFSYFYGYDGVYEFNGADSRRISDLILPEMNAVKATLRRVVANTWDTEAEFDAGGFYNCVSSGNGVVVMVDSAVLCSIDNSESNPLSQSEVNSVLGGESKVFDFVAISTVEFPGGFSEGLFSRFGFRYSFNIDCVNSVAYATVTIRNSNTGVSVSSNNVVLKCTLGLGEFKAHQAVLDFPTSVVFTRDEIVHGSAAVKVVVTNPVVDHTVNISTLGVNLENSAVVYSSRAQFMSEVATVSTITGWEDFLANYASNGGNISFFVKAASTVFNLSTPAWSPISPGNRIPFDAGKNRVVWAASFTATNMGVPSLDSVSLEHNEGGASDTLPFGFSWKNNFNLVVTTITNSTSSVIFRKARITHSVPDAWMPIVGVNIRSWTRAGNEVLYGGSSSTGVVYRMEYGTNFDGVPIELYYESPDLFLGSNFFYKSVFELLVDVDEAVGASYTVGVSVNGGEFSDVAFSIAGSRRRLRSIYNLDKYGKYFRFRLRNSDDAAPAFHGLGIVYQPFPER